MIEILGVVATVLAVVGVILNNRKIRACFYVWIFSNALCAVIHWQAGVWSLFMRDWIFVGLAIEGVWLWRKKRVLG